MRLWNDFLSEKRAENWARLICLLGYWTITYGPFDSEKPQGAMSEAWTVEVF